MAVVDLREAEVPDKMDMWEAGDPYFDWIEREGVKRIVEYKFEDLSDVELGDWERKGGKGAVINIPNAMLPNDAHLVEIKPGGKSEPESHMYEEVMYVVSGRGATSVWLSEGQKATFEWAAGSLLVIPLNAAYQHFNGSGTEPARYVSMTNAPPVMRMFRSNEFVFNNSFRFKDRFSGEDEDFFNGQGTLYQRKGSKFGTMWKTNFVPNADIMRLWKYRDRGAGGINTHFDLAGNVTGAHISEFPAGTYKKGHRHGPGAHLVILGGVGFSRCGGTTTRLSTRSRRGRRAAWSSFPQTRRTTSTSTPALSLRATWRCGAGTASQASGASRTSASRKAGCRSSTRTKTGRSTASSSPSSRSMARRAG